MPDSLSELQRHVWRRLGVRKYIAGRDSVCELVEMAVANWDEAAVSNATTQGERDIVTQGMVIAIKRTHQMLGDYGDEDQEYGFLWAILFQALVGAIVQILIKWWLESQQNRATMMEMRKEIVG